MEQDVVIQLVARFGGTYIASQGPWQPPTWNLGPPTNVPQSSITSGNFDSFPTIYSLPLGSEKCGFVTK